MLRMVNNFVTTLAHSAPARRTENLYLVEPISKYSLNANNKSLLSQGKLRNAAVNFDT